MALIIGIIGMPNVGKSTLFNSLTLGAAEASNYPFCTVEPNVGVVPVPDGRLAALEAVLQPHSTTPTSIQFVDIAGLVRGANRGEGLGNQFLGHIAQADALVHVLRCFADEQISHVEGGVDPLRDAEIVETELLLADLERTTRAVERLDKVVRSDPRSTQKAELATLEQCCLALQQGRPIRDLDLSGEGASALKGYNLLTDKPLLYLANVAEEDSAEAKAAEPLRQAFGAERVLTVSAAIEAEIALLDPAEREEFVAELGLEESGVKRLIAAGYRLLGLSTFYTQANDKLQAWQITAGASAPQAAGSIHTDMEQGFIRAEVVAAEELLACGSMAAARHLGKLRTEGRDYLVEDGDVVNFLFKA